MTIYLLYLKLTDSTSNKNPDWIYLSKQYGFKIIKETPTIAKVEASEDTIDLLKKNHPYIYVTDEKKYHTSYSK
jgi:hypothetical protein